MDPISIIGLVGSLVPTVVRTTKSLNDIKTKYAQSNATISAIICECSVISTALTHIESIAKNDPEGLAARLDPRTGQLGSSFELALDGCSITLTVLNDEIGKITGSGKPGFLGWKSKAKFLWNEEEMKDLLTTIRGQQSALQLLLAAIQTESISDVRRILNDNNSLLKQMVQRSQTLREKRASSTGDDRNQELDGSSSIKKSSSYRRSIRSMVKRPASDTPGKLHQSSSMSGEFHTPIYEMPGSTPSYTKDVSFDNDNSLSTEALRLQQTHLEQSTPQRLVSRKPVAELATTSSNKTISHRERGYSSRLHLDNSPVSELSSPLSPQTPMRNLADPVSPPVNNSSQNAREDAASPDWNITQSLYKGGTNQGNLGSDYGDGKEIPTPKKEDVIVLVPPPPRNPASDPLLRTAAEKGHAPLIKLLYQKGADVNSTDSTGKTPLMLAAQNGHLQVVREILQLNPTLDTKNSDGNAAMNLACLSTGKVQIIEALLDAGADIEIGGIEGWHPLHHAAANGMVPIIDFLLKRGAQLEAKADYGSRPLHSAVLWGQKMSVASLIQHGADMEAQNSAGNRPLNDAAIKNNVEITKVLLDRGANIEGVGICNWRPLHHAVCNGSVSVLDLLIERGADKEATADLGARPLHIASDKTGLQWDPKCLSLQALLKHKVDLEARQQEGNDNQAIHLAAEAGHMVALKLLVAAGLNIHNRGWHGFTPLHGACAWGQATAVEWLLEQGADKERIADNEGRPIHAATQYGNIDTVRKLLCAGVEVNVHREDGTTPLGAAACRGLVDMMGELIRHGASIEKAGYQGEFPIHGAVRFGKIIAVQYLLDMGANPDSKNNSGHTPLIEAARFGHAEIAEILIRVGANIEASDGDGSRPLHHAAIHGHARVMLMLITSGAEKGACANNGDTPLHVAAFLGKLDAVKVLLDHGASVDKTQVQGKTALDCAVERGHLQIVELLLQ